MSKSLGNFVTVHELLTEWQGHAWPGEALRFNMLRTHYRKPLDWTHTGLEESHKTLWDWYGDVENAAPVASQRSSCRSIEALSDDLNTPKVIAAVPQAASFRRISKSLGAAGLEFLGFSARRSRIERTRVDDSETRGAGRRAILRRWTR